MQHKSLLWWVMRCWKALGQEQMLPPSSIGLGTGLVCCHRCQRAPQGASSDTKTTGANTWTMTKSKLRPADRAGRLDSRGQFRDKTLKVLAKVVTSSPTLCRESSSEILLAARFWGTTESESTSACDAARWDASGRFALGAAHLFPSSYRPSSFPLPPSWIYI